MYYGKARVLMLGRRREHQQCGDCSFPIVVLGKSLAFAIEERLALKSVHNNQQRL